MKRILVVCCIGVWICILQGCGGPFDRAHGGQADRQGSWQALKPGKISSLAEYKAQREMLIKSIRPESDKLTAIEQKAAERFESLKRQIYNSQEGASPWVSKPFYDVKDKIEKTHLYKVIEQMPKGSILHVHPSAMGDLHKAIDKAMASKKAYVVTEGSNRGMISFASGDGRAAAVAMSESGLSEADLMKCVTIGAEDESISDIWPEFENIFGRMSEIIANYPYEDYLYDAIEYYALKDNVQHIELREHLPGKADIETYERIKSRLAENGIDITIRLIYCDSRVPGAGESVEQRCQGLKRSINRAIDMMQKYPDMVCGFDVYAEEDKGLPANLMAELLIEGRQKAEQKGVAFNLYLHNGESIFPVSFNANDEFSEEIPKYYNNNVMDVYLLGAKRIGHGFELARLPQLANYYKQQGICVELCPISNQLLRYFKDLRNHPGVSLFNQGVAITISPDDPAIFGYQGVSFDYWAAVMAWDMSLADVKKCIQNSIEYSCLKPAEKTELMKKWQKRWADFVNGLGEEGRNRSKS